jgi:hypothetical protein
MYIEWAKLIGGWFFSWPVAIILVALIFRNEIRLWLDNVTKLKAGPVQIETELKAVAEAGKTALDSVSQMIILLGESRMTELQVTLKTVGQFFLESDQQIMQEQISQIAALLEKIKGDRGHVIVDTH